MKPFLTLCLFTTIMSAQAGELRIPIYAESQHYNITGAYKFNHRHPMAGAEYKGSSMVVGAYSYVDSYYIPSQALYFGHELGKVVYIGYNAGVTYKGHVYPNKGIEKGLLPLFILNSGLTLGPYNVSVNYVPVPKEYGSSVVFARFALKINI